MSRHLINHRNLIGFTEIGFTDIGYTETEPSDSEVLHIHMYAALAAAALVLLVWLV